MKIWLLPHQRLRHHSDGTDMTLSPSVADTIKSAVMKLQVIVSFFTYKNIEKATKSSKSKEAAEPIVEWNEEVISTIASAACEIPTCL
jgi:hypothetical protein